MTHEQWKFAWSVYSEASTLFGADLDAFLAARDLPVEVAAEVRQLLAERHAREPDPAGMAELRVGPYRLVHSLGEGAMGAVYRAEQQGPLRRTVALKIVRPGLRSKEVLERFEIERRVLAMMDHPGIARVYDAGETDAGRPYFAMEYVPGLPVTVFSEQNGLTVRQRLDLVAELCLAIQHAHQKGIIHRDIKPSNVLVSVVDGRPAVKVIDFGVARATRADEAATLATQFGSVVGTLAYMSPEQAAFETPSADTRSDIYSIGALAYELLTGSPPLAVETGGGSQATTSLAAALYRIQHEDPPPPSVRAKDMGREARALAGEVDWILMKALDKDPSQRYQSANALAQDIQRHQGGEAVEAGPPSRTYKLRKLARSYRRLLVTAAAFMAILTLAAAVSIRQAIRATSAEQAAVIERDRAVAAQREAAAERDRAIAAEQTAQRERHTAVAERRRADEESTAAHAISGFLRDDLLGQATAVAQANRQNTPTRDLKVRDALDRAAASIDGKFGAQPTVEAAIRYTIGFTYHDLGIYPSAKDQLERSLALRRRALPRDHPDTLAALHSLASVARGEGRYADAHSIYRDAYERRRRTLGSRHPDTLRSLHGVAITLRSLGRHAEAIRTHEQVLETRLKALGEHHPDTMRSLNDLAVAHLYGADIKRGLELARRAYESRLRALGPDHPDTATSHHAHAMALYNNGLFEEADRVFEQVVPRMERLHGRDHAETISTLVNYGNNLTSMHRYAEALPIRTEAFERRRRLSGERNFQTLILQGDLGMALVNLARFEEGPSHLRKCWEGLRADLGSGHPETQRANHNLTLALIAAGENEEAIRVGEEGLEVRRRVRGPAHGATVLITIRLAEAYSGAGRHGDAVAILRRAIAERRDDGPAHSLKTTLTLVLLRQGRFAEAEPMARESVARYGGASGWNVSVARVLLGSALAGQGKFTAAGPLLTSGMEGLRRESGSVGGADRRKSEEMRSLAGSLYERSGKAVQALGWPAR